MIDRPPTTRKRTTYRFKATPSSVEINISAIPFLPQTGWRLTPTSIFPLIGTVPKDYLSYGDPTRPHEAGYFAKKGRTNNSDARECVTEEIMSKIGSTLPIHIAESRLVRISRTDVRFMSKNFVSKGQAELVHGIELAANYFQTSASDVESAFNLSDRKQEALFYTIENMCLILDTLYPSDCEQLKTGFFKMIAFDAFVGAPDRHAMNWGVLIPAGGQAGLVTYAPVFDTARGLFREMSDEHLQERVQRHGRSSFISTYANKSRPIFSTATNQKHNHFTLIEWIFLNCSQNEKDAIMAVWSAVDLEQIERMLQRGFRRIVTQFRINMILDLLHFRIETLRKVSG